MAPAMRRFAKELGDSPLVEPLRQFACGQFGSQGFRMEVLTWLQQQGFLHGGLQRAWIPVVYALLLANAALVPGEVVLDIQPPRKSVFWSKGIGQYQGQPQGQGLLYLEMVVVDQFVDLSRLPYALVETLRTLIKIILPFSVIIVVSLLTRPDNPAHVDRFYLKIAHC